MRHPARLEVAPLRKLKQRRVARVGSDHSVGKMLTAIELCARSPRGWDSDWIATSQTGIMIHGDGIAVDHVLSDYINLRAGAPLLRAHNREVVVVEGQGSVYHPAYSGVTVGCCTARCPTRWFSYISHAQNVGHYERFALPGASRCAKR